MISHKFLLQIIILLTILLNLSFEGDCYCNLQISLIDAIDTKIVCHIMSTSFLIIYDSHYALIVFRITTIKALENLLNRFLIKTFFYFI